MSDKNMDRPWVVGKRQIELRGSFKVLSGAGTIDATKVTGLGFGFAPVNGVMALRAQPQNNPTPLSTPGILRTNTGLYTITFENPYLELVSFHPHLATAAGGVNLFAQAIEPVTGTNTAQTGPTITVQLVNGSGAATEGATTQRLHFVAVFRDSTWSYQKP